MPIFPNGSLLTFTDSVGSVVANVAVNNVRYKVIRKHFERAEFMHERLLGAPNEDGSKPVIQQLAGNRPVQYLTPCNPDETVRPLTPDDDDLDSIYQRFDIKQWTMSGTLSLVSEVDKLFEMHKKHQVLLARFDAYQSVAKGNVSYNFLVGLQAETFSYLTTTTVAMRGNVFNTLGVGQYFTNLLVTDFGGDYAAEVAQNSAATAGTSLVLSDWSFAVEQWTLVPARSLVY